MRQKGCFKAFSCIFSLQRSCCFFFRRNINSQNASYLKSCIHNLKGDKNCPIFRVGDIVKSCGQNFIQVAFYVSMKVLIYYSLLTIFKECNEISSIVSCVFLTLQTFPKDHLPKCLKQVSWKMGKISGESISSLSLCCS